MDTKHPDQTSCAHIWKEGAEETGDHYDDWSPIYRKVWTCKQCKETRYNDPFAVSFVSNLVLLVFVVAVAIWLCRLLS